MANVQELKQYRNIHLIGIGGTSMSGIAQILKHWGYNVSGSDANASDNTDKLTSNNIYVTIGSDPSILNNVDLVIYSAAIHDTDPELSKARELGIPTVERGPFLGQLTHSFRNTIAISGTHGKSTTSAMVSMCFIEAKQDPTIQIGANIPAINGNYRLGNSENFIIESCEYADSFLNFAPKAEIILNIDNDHLDYFQNLDNIKAAFIKFVKLLPDDGILVYNADDENSSHISKNTKAKSITFGLKNKSANFIAKNISYDKNGFPSFDVYHNNSFYKTIKLSIPGEHNVLNALSCIALCNEFGIDKIDIKNALLKYTGVQRRFEYIGKVKNAKVFDDYGHHPTEIRAVADALHKKQYNHSWVVFQPHTFSRTVEHLDEFAEVLTSFDNIIVTDIYAARETNTYGISSRDIINKIDHLGRKAYYISNFDDIIDFIKRNIQPNDIILTQGAGTVTKIAHKLVDEE